MVFEAWKVEPIIAVVEAVIVPSKPERKTLVNIAVGVLVGGGRGGSRRGGWRGEGTELDPEEGGAGDLRGGGRCRL